MQKFFFLLTSFLIFITPSVNAMDFLSSGWTDTHEMAALGGYLYLIDKSDDKLKKVDPSDGQIIGTVGSIVWSETSTKPVRMVAHNGYLYIIQNQSLHKVDPSNGSYTYGPGIWSGANLELAAVGSYLYIIQNKILHQVSPSTLTYTQYYTNTQWSEYTNRPVEMIGANGKLYIVNNATIHEVDPSNGQYVQLGSDIWTGDLKMAANSDWLYIVQNDTLHEIDLNYRDSGGNITYSTAKNMSLMTGPDIGSIQALTYAPGVSGYDRVISLNSSQLRSMQSNFCELLQDQIDAAGSGTPSNWKTVSIPAGEYYCGAEVRNHTSPSFDFWSSLFIRDTSYLKIQGAGISNSILRLRIGDRAGTNAIYLGSNLDGIEISDFNLIGNSPSAYPDPQSVINKLPLYSFHRAIGSQSYALNSTQDTAGDGVINCVYCNHKDHIANNISSSNIKNLYIHDLQIQEVGLGIEVSGVKSRGTTGSGISDNIFIKNNIIKSVGPFQTGGGWGYGIKITDLGGRQYVLDNQFYDIARHSIYKGGGDGQTLILGNLILRNGNQIALSASRSNNTTAAFNVIVDQGYGRLLSLEDSDLGINIGHDSSGNPLAPFDVFAIGNHFHGFNTGSNSISPALELYSHQRTINWAGSTCTEVYHYLDSIEEILSPTTQDQGDSPVQAVGNGCNMTCYSKRNLTLADNAETPLGCSYAGTVLNGPHLNYPAPDLWGADTIIKPIMSATPAVTFNSTSPAGFEFSNSGIVILQSGAIHVVTDSSWYTKDPDDWSYTWAHVTNGSSTVDIAASEGYVYWMASDGVSHRVYRSPINNLTSSDVLTYSNSNLVNFNGDGNLNFHYSSSGGFLLVNDAYTTVAVDEGTFEGYSVTGPSKASSVNAWVQSIAGNQIEVVCSSSYPNCISTEE